MTPTYPIVRDWLHQRCGAKIPCKYVRRADDFLRSGLILIVRRIGPDATVEAKVPKELFPK